MQNSLNQSVSDDQTMSFVNQAQVLSQQNIKLKRSIGQLLFQIEQKDEEILFQIQNNEKLSELNNQLNHHIQQLVKQQSQVTIENMKRMRNKIAELEDANLQWYDYYQTMDDQIKEKLRPYREAIQQLKEEKKTIQLDLEAEKKKQSDESKVLIDKQELLELSQQLGTIKQELKEQHDQNNLLLSQNNILKCQVSEKDSEIKNLFKQITDLQEQQKYIKPNDLIFTKSEATMDQKPVNVIQAQELSSSESEQKTQGLNVEGPAQSTIVEPVLTQLNESSSSSISQQILEQTEIGKEQVTKDKENQQTQGDQPVQQPHIKSQMIETDGFDKSPTFNEHQILDTATNCVLDVIQLPVSKFSDAQRDNNDDSNMIQASKSPSTDEMNKLQKFDEPLAGQPDSTIESNHPQNLDIPYAATLEPDPTEHIKFLETQTAETNVNDQDIDKKQKSNVPEIVEGTGEQQELISIQMQTVHEDKKDDQNVINDNDQTNNQQAENQ